MNLHIWISCEPLTGNEGGYGTEILPSDSTRCTENLSAELPNSCALAYPRGEGTATPLHPPEGCVGPVPPGWGPQALGSLIPLLLNISIIFSPCHDVKQVGSPVFENCLGGLCSLPLPPHQSGVNGKWSRFTSEDMTWAFRFLFLTSAVTWLNWRVWRCQK